MERKKQLLSILGEDSTQHRMWCWNISDPKWRDENLSKRLIRKYRILASAVPDLRKITDYEAGQIRIHIEYIAENSGVNSMIGRSELAELLGEYGFGGHAYYVANLRKIDDF